VCVRVLYLQEIGITTCIYVVQGVDATDLE